MNEIIKTVFANSLETIVMKEAVSPPGWSGTVKKMKEKHPEIDNPWSLSWWMHNEGYQPHVKEEKE